MILFTLVPPMYVSTSKVIISHSISLYRFGIKIWTINIENVNVKRGNGGTWRTHPALLIFDKDEKEIGWILASLFGDEALEKIETHINTAKMANRPSGK